MSPKRRQPKRAQTKMPTNRNLDSSKRWQTKTLIEQNLKKPKHRQTETLADQNERHPLSEINHLGPKKPISSTKLLTQR